MAGVGVGVEESLIFRLSPPRKTTVNYGHFDGDFEAG
jgi:hypothetical protein